MTQDGRGERERVRLPVLTVGAPSAVDRWIVEALGAQPPTETTATCDDCVMLPEEGSRAEGAEYFDASARCCTYTPELANFLVGAALGDATSPGRASVLARMRTASRVTPLGLGVSESDADDYARSLKAGTFGRDLSPLSPPRRRRVLDLALPQCDLSDLVLQARPRRAMAFWRQGVEPLLQCVERALARHCAVTLDIPAVQ